MDTQTTDFTVAGIGDMSGDVFGNGMLLSRHIRLVAAFDHRHIFLDPESRRGGELRRARAHVQAAALDLGRLRREAALARRRHPSAQRQVDRDHAGSEGGAGDRRRRADADRARQRDPQGAGRPALQRRHRHLRQGDERDARAGRRPRQRRAARQRPRASLQGRSPRAATSAARSSGRIEFAQAGGRIYTDAIDNSAGVDTSDHEVNIKILLGLPIADGELTEKQRNAAARGDDRRRRRARAARQLLPDAGAVGHRPHRAAAARRAGALHAVPREERPAQPRASSTCPPTRRSPSAARRGAGSTTPERAVLLAYSKIWLYDELMASPLPDDPWVATALAALLPAGAAAEVRGLHAAPSAEARDHRDARAQQHDQPRRQHVRASPVRDHRRASRTRSCARISLAREIFGLVPLWQAIEALDNKVDDAVQSQMLIDTSAPARARHDVVPALAAAWPKTWRATIAYFRPGVEALSAQPAEAARCGRAGARRREGRASSSATACRATSPRASSRSTRCTRRSTSPRSPPTATRPVELVASDLLRPVEPPRACRGCARRSRRCPGDAHWQMLAKAAMQDDVSGLTRTVTARGRARRSGSAADRIAAWRDKQPPRARAQRPVVHRAARGARAGCGDAVGCAARAALARMRSADARDGARRRSRHVDPCRVVDARAPP